MHKYEIPSNITNSSSLFVTIIAEVENELNNCENTFLYVADGGAGALVVYDYKKESLGKYSMSRFKQIQISPDTVLMV